jgi:hypothetical protein
VTEHAEATWVIQQLREAFPFDTAPRYAILDRDGKYGHLVPVVLHTNHDDRCHLGLHKDAPEPRVVTPQHSPCARVVALPRVGGLQHRYEWRQAA